jgi:hypothetical protein
MLQEEEPYSIEAKTKLGKIVSDFDGHSRASHFVGQTFVSANLWPANSKYRGPNQRLFLLYHLRRRHVILLSVHLVTTVLRLVLYVR